MEDETPRVAVADTAQVHLLHVFAGERYTCHFCGLTLQQYREMPSSCSTPLSMSSPATSTP